MPKTSTPRKTAKRTYHSPRRQEQASVTKKRIVLAAMQQLQEKGYADMTLESIARAAGVAPQTVYAVCGAKKGILAAILENFVESNKFDTLRDEIPTIKNGEERVRALAKFLTTLLENAAPGFHLIRGLSVVAPDLVEMEVDYEKVLYEKSHKQIQEMFADGLIRPGLDVTSAADAVWSLGTPGLYRRLIGACGWSSERYAFWLANMLAYILLPPEQITGTLPSWEDHPQTTNR